MFRKLRLKLTLINVVVVGLLFLFFISGTFVVMQIGIFNQSNQLMIMLAKEAGSEQPGNLREHQHELPHYFIVKTTAGGKIAESSSDLPITQAQLAPVLHNILEQHRPRGRADFNGEYYSFLRAPLQTGGDVVVLVNIQHEWDILRFLLFALSGGTVVILILVYYGSRFMADRALIPIKESWQRQKDFVADASHELRTPLTVIQTNLELVMGNPDESVASQAQWLENIQSESKQMTKLVNDLLFLARADSEQQNLNLQHFELSTAIDEVLRPLIPMAEARGINLAAKLDTPTTVYGDENRIKQVVVIMLDNAIKHTPPDGQVTVQMQVKPDAVEIIVTDTGEGIAPEHHKKIFERFYRVDKARSKQQGGTGLGLAIADWIIRSHNGSITVTSAPGGGTTFCICLPK